MRNIIAVNQDESVIALRELLNSGFTEVTWIYDGTKCPKCRSLDGKKWKLANFIKNLMYEAAIFEKSHVGCRCRLAVKKTNGETAIVDWSGLKNIQRKAQPVKQPDKIIEKPVDKRNWFKKILNLR